MHLKETQNELKARTHLKCGLENIHSDQQCQQWSLQNAQFYSQNASQHRLQNCSSYFHHFKTAGDKPVRKIVLLLTSRVVSRVENENCKKSRVCEAH